MKLIRIVLGLFLVLLFSASAACGSPSHHAAPTQTAQHKAHHKRHPCAKYHKHKARRACRIRHKLYPVTPPITHSVAADNRPNIVMVLADDFSTDLIKPDVMPNLWALQLNQSVVFNNASVVDSLCCPSRTSIFTGEFPHNHSVVDNTIDNNGGFLKYIQQGDQYKSFAISLHNSGYTTGFVGKYLNQYNSPVTNWPDDGSYNQRGWDWWAGVGEAAYSQYNYNITFDNQIVQKGNAASDYATDVIGNQAQGFVQRNLDANRPFFLEMATYATHQAIAARDDTKPHFAYKYQMADQDSPWFGNGFDKDYPAASWANYNEPPENAPMWLRDLPAWSDAKLAQFREYYNERLDQAADIDRQIGDLMNEIKAVPGEWQNTYFVFTSDNGLHMGTDRLNDNKMTAYEQDIHVPLIIHGPDAVVNNNRSDDHIVENIDLAPTFEDIANSQTDTSQVDGHSLMPLLTNTDGGPVTWRRVAAIEHTRPAYDASDPDAQPVSAYNPPSYVALRAPTYTYIQYKDGEHEYYDRTTDPNETVNTYPSVGPNLRGWLEDRVARLSTCSGEAECWTAGNVDTY